MKSLQLYCINYGYLSDACAVVEHCLKVLPIFSDPIVLHPGCELVPKIATWETAFGNIKVIRADSHTQNECFTKEMPKYITCDHALGIQWDGFIVRPDLWDESWLQYDWIAPPWPLQNIPNPDHRVGSGGFCMFSKRMSDAWLKVIDLESNNDWQIGATRRNELEALGMKYAPVEVAEKFGREIPIEDSTVKEGESFGFHDFRHEIEHREKYRKLVYG